jgi:alpha-tubulin suppressor-like RCC1 family protein
VTAVTAGEVHVCALLSGGTVDCWGANGNGQIGQGTTSGSYSSPRSVSGLSNVTALAAGQLHTCALLQGGTVECWGDNEFGELGNGTTTGPSTCVSGYGCATTPVAVSGLSGVTSIAAGDAHTCALLQGGTVECWGNNAAGQLGTGSVASSTTPVAVTGLSGTVTAIAAGVADTCALMQNGTVQCWGDDIHGQLGNGSTTAPTSCGGVLEPCSKTPVTVTGVANATALTVGEYHACVVVSGGSVQCWGYNADGELGQGTTTGPSTCYNNPCSPTPVEVSGL